MTNNNFYLDFNVTGAERKRLVQALAEYTGADAKYLGAPSFAYEVDTFTVDRNGTVSFADRMASEEVEALLGTLADAGFVSQASNLDCEENGDEPLTPATAAEIAANDEEPSNGPRRSGKRRTGRIRRAYGQDAAGQGRSRDTYQTARSERRLDPQGPRYSGTSD